MGIFGLRSASRGPSHPIMSKGCCYTPTPALLQPGREPGSPSDSLPRPLGLHSPGPRVPWDVEPGGGRSGAPSAPGWLTSFLVLEFASDSSQLLGRQLGHCHFQRAPIV